MQSNRFGRRQKKRSGWKHPHDINRNRRRCAKRRRSANVQARLALQSIRADETLLEVLEARIGLVARPPRSTRGGPERRSTTRLQSRRGLVAG